MNAISNATHAELTIDVHTYARAEGVTPATVYKRIARGKLPARQRGRHTRLRIPVAEAA